MCTAVLIGWDPATLPPPALGFTYEGAIGQPRDRRHLFATTWYTCSKTPLLPPPPYPSCSLLNGSVTTLAWVSCLLISPCRVLSQVLLSLAVTTAAVYSSLIKLSLLSQLLFHHKLYTFCTQNCDHTWQPPTPRPPPSGREIKWKKHYKNFLNVANAVQYLRTPLLPDFSLDTFSQYVFQTWKVPEIFWTLGLSRAFFRGCYAPSYLSLPIIWNVTNVIFYILCAWSCSYKLI